MEEKTFPVTNYAGDSYEKRVRLFHPMVRNCNRQLKLAEGEEKIKEEAEYKRHVELKDYFNDQGVI